MRAIKTALALLNPRLRVSYSENCLTNITNAVAVVAAPFNRYLEGMPPDASNAAIAQLVISYVWTGCPFIGQWEHTDLLRRKALPVVEYRRGGRGEWVKTHELMRWAAKEVAKLKQGNVVLIIGHPHHVRRVSILARHYGLDPRVLHDCEKVPYDPRERPGYQWWCTNAWRYIPWEYLLARPKLVIDVLLGRL